MYAYRKAGRSKACTYQILKKNKELCASKYRKKFGEFQNILNFRLTRVARPALADFQKASHHTHAIFVKCGIAQEGREMPSTESKRRIAGLATRAVLQSDLANLSQPTEAPLDNLTSVCAVFFVLLFSPL